ncbi:hypothetical protein TRVA0_089S00210 [Trichomonascus vanleenenianus]|uniref:NAD(P)-dependent alcohol dehydrogenase n=1 Tax=Trichomonascus vanleenenianus TaxID=2268995 RepID=UPI003EC95648
MKAWLYSSTSGGFEKNLKFNPSARAPPKPGRGEVFIKVLSAGLNPVDYKLPEAGLGLISRLLVGRPASPGMEYCGLVVSTGAGVTGFTPGQRVYGCQQLTKFGSLAEYLLAPADSIAPIPEGVETDHAAGIPLAGQTAYQSLQPYVSSGDKVFINGGSGGCGIYAIQIAKLLGCHVTTTCSTRNVEFCRSLGADEVIDYTAEEDLTATLRNRGVIFDHIVDHIGLPASLYRDSHYYLKRDGVFVQIGAAKVITFADRCLRPSILGGGKRKYNFFLRKNDPKQLAQLAEWTRQGDMKVHLDKVYEFSEVLQAFEKLQSGRTRGKIVVHIANP